MPLGENTKACAALRKRARASPEAKAKDCRPRILASPKGTWTRPYIQGLAVGYRRPRNGRTIAFSEPEPKRAHSGAR